MFWKVKNQHLPQTHADFLDVILENRDVTDREAFFQPKHPLHLTLEEVGIDPLQVKVALERLEQARQNQEDVLIFGDYDVDGISSTAILWEALHGLGVKARPFIPHREKHGYGLSDRALNDILAGQKPQLVVTVDNGIVAHAAVDRLVSEGIDVIITDHHQPEMENDTWVYPNCLATVHTTQLCGATVSWMLAREWYRFHDKGWTEPETECELELCAIATIADQVPLLNANRSFAKHGLEALKHTQRLGLKKLMQSANIQPEAISTASVHFGIAPRINAMGRLKHGLDALRLLCTNNADRAQELVETLTVTNSERQDITYDMVDDAKAQAKRWENEHIIIVHSTQYHEGVIGLIAGKLMEEYYKPAIAIAVNEVSAKASARSIPGVNIVDLIRQVRHDLLEVGGHPMAAGFSLEAGKVETVLTQLQSVAREQISVEMLQPAVDVECLLPAELVSHELVNVLAECQPFGTANPEPVVGIKGVKVLEAMTMGRDNKHLRLVVDGGPFKGAPKGTHSEPIKCIGWSMGPLAADLEPGMMIDVAGVVEINEWKGRQMIQVRLKDVVVA